MQSFHFTDYFCKTLVTQENCNRLLIVILLKEDYESVLTCLIRSFALHSYSVTIFLYLCLKNAFSKSSVCLYVTENPSDTVHNRKLLLSHMSCMFMKVETPCLKEVKVFSQVGTNRLV